MGLPPYTPLYTPDDVVLALPLFEEVAYGHWFTIEPGIEVMYTDAGHIIGSAAVHLRIKENGKTNQISFSGDVGRYGDVILRSPDVFPQADYIIIESTYGNKLHDKVVDTADQLFQWIQKTCMHKKGKLIIPAFSVGRTQELLYFINLLSNQKKLGNIRVYVDSPLSKEATDVIRSHPENFNAGIRKLLKTDNDPFDFVKSGLLAEGKLDPTRYKDVLMHRIDGGEALEAFAGLTKALTSASLIHSLRDLAQVRARAWLTKHYSALGVQCSVNIKQDYLDDLRVPVEARQ